MTSTSRGLTVADTQLTWVDRLPPFLRDYAVLARLDRPIGTWLLLLPCWFGLSLTPGTPDLWLIFCFAVGAFAMRGAGCTINDMVDRKFDAMVERTRNRPIAAGRISIPGAIVFVALQMLIGLWVLTQIGTDAAIIALSSLPLIVAYPFMKRITYWPQVFLGITFNWGILVGAAAGGGSLDLPVLMLYMGAIAWTVGYDTIYAHMDKDDDLAVGVKSSALALGDRSAPAIAACYGFFWAMTVAASLMAGHPPWILAGLLVVAWLLWRNVRGLDINDIAGCLTRFRANRNIGLALTIVLIIGGLSAG